MSGPHPVPPIATCVRAEKRNVGYQEPNFAPTMTDFGRKADLSSTPRKNAEFRPKPDIKTAPASANTAAAESR